MQVMVEVTDEIRREAEKRGQPIVDFVDTLVRKGMEAIQGRVSFDSAIERIRALRSAAPIPPLPKR
jgi:hypothetical protein